MSREQVRLLVFDFDGVLCDCRRVHYEALNAAISEVDPKYIITPEEHTSTYDGLSTRKKLEMLTLNKQLPTDAHARIHARKQAFTIEAIKANIEENPKLISMMTTLKERGYKLVVASNAIHDTIYHGLLRLGVWNIFDRIYSNEDVRPDRQKPHPDIYLKCMVDMGCSPDEVVIIEDSRHGREAAYKSGAYVCGVDNPADLTSEVIEQAIVRAKPKPKRFVGGRVNIVCAMSGLGSRFAQAGYKMPKPLIDVAGKPMIQRVVENIPVDGKWIFVVQRAHYDGYYLGTLLNSIAPGCEVICVDGQTEGAACSVLKAKHLIDNDEHLIIANSDQWVDWDCEQFMWSMISSEADGGILSFTDTNPKWSFAKVGEDGWVCEVAEKKPISDQATVGVYYWKHGKSFVHYARQMIEQDLRVKGEFYVCPVFQLAIDDGKKIKTHSCKGMYGMGTPEDLQQTIQTGVFDV